MKIPKNLHKMSKPECVALGREWGRKEGRDCGFQTGLYLALAGYYNTKPDDIVSDETFAQWSKNAEAECVRIFNEDIKGDFDVVKKAIVTKEGKTKENIEDRVEYALTKISGLREYLEMEKL